MTHPLTHETQRACLKALASVADRVGFDVPLAQYNQAQATDVIEAVTQAYEAMIRSASNPRGHKVTPPLDGFEDETIPF